jgi:uncharacterized protein (UPF0332 family)
MKRVSKEEVIEHRIKRSNEALMEAELMFKNDFLSATINRLYYSCFYIVTALLIKNDIKVKSHAGVRQMLGLHFIQTDIIPKTHGKFYSNLFGYRHENDYGDFLIPDEQFVAGLIKQTRDFLANINNVIKNNPSDTSKTDH